MPKQTHYINNKVVQLPVNAPELSIELNFKNDRVDQAVTVTSFRWVEDAYQIIKTAFDQGRTGGGGVLTGLPHRIEISDNGSNYTVFDGIIDMRTAQWGEFQVEVDSVDNNSNDWLTEKADGVSYGFLFNQGKFDESDYVPVPYVLNSIPNYRDTFLATITLTYVSQQLIEKSLMLAGKLGAIGTVINAPGGVVELVFLIIQVIGLLVALVKLILDLVDLVIQPVKYKMAMSLNRLIEIGANELGLTYKSGLLQSEPWSRLHIIPRQFVNPESQQDDRILGFIQPNDQLQTGYYDGQFGDLLRAVKQMFNARVSVEGGQLTIETYDIPSAARFQIPDIHNPEFTTNASDVVASYNITFATDQSDLTTLQQWTGTNVSVQLSHITNPGQRSLLTGFFGVSIPFALAKRKEDLSAPEKGVDILLDTVSPIIGALVTAFNIAIEGINAVIRKVNKVKKALKPFIDIKFELEEIEKLRNPNLSGLIENRLGMMLIEKDMISVDRIALLDVNSEPSKTKISFANSLVVNAKNLFANFYQSASFAPGAKTAQRYIYNYENVEMSFTDVVNVRDDRAARLPDGTIAEVLSCTYNPDKQIANFEVAERKAYINSIKQEISEPKGT